MDPEDFLEILRRNKSWVAGPVLACLVITVVVAFLWPELAGGPIGVIWLLLALAWIVLELIVHFLICRGVNFMGRLHLTTVQAQQPAMGLRLY